MKAIGMKSIESKKVKFQTLQGESVKFTTSSACSSQQDCDRKTLRVQYDPSMSNQARIYSDTTLNTRVGGYILFALVYFLLVIGVLVFDLGDRPTRFKLSAMATFNLQDIGYSRYVSRWRSPQCYPYSYPLSEIALQFLLNRQPSD